MLPDRKKLWLAIAIAQDVLLWVTRTHGGELGDSVLHDFPNTGPAITALAVCCALLPAHGEVLWPALQRNKRRSAKQAM